MYTCEIESSLILMKDSVHSVYSWEIEYTVFNHESWSSQHFHIRDVIHKMFS